MVLEQQVGLSWPNRAGGLQQGQSVDTLSWTEGRRSARGQDGGLDWAEAGEQSVVGWVLSAVAYTEQRSPEDGVCLPGSCLDSSLEASVHFHPWTIVPLLGFLRRGMHKGH